MATRARQFGKSVRAQTRVASTPAKSLARASKKLKVVNPRRQDLVTQIFGTADPERIHAAIRAENVSGKALSKVLVSLQLKKTELAPVLAMREKTIARREAPGKKLSKSEADRLYRLMRIVDFATNMLGEREKALRWLRNAIPSLGGARPIELLESDVGTAQVERVLYSIGYGGVA